MNSADVPRKVVIIGAGVSGLTVAYELAERSERLAQPIEITCLEAGDHPGGNIRTDEVDGFLCEWGPNGFLDNAKTTLTLVRRLGLGEEMLPARKESEIRYIYRAGKLRTVPTGPGAFFRSDILSPLGKLRVLGEPFVSRRTADGDESVFDFAARRIGKQAAAILVDAMVSGVYAGDARQLSLGATFPKMRDMERTYGGLFRAMLGKRKEAKEKAEDDDEAGNGAKAPAGGPAGPGGRLTSFVGGMQNLTDRLAEKLGDRLKRNTPVRSVSDMGLRGMRVHPEHGAPIDVDAVIVAVPAWRAAPMLESMDSDLSGVLTEISPAPLAVVHLGYRENAVGDRPRGFGFLVPRGQNADILGTLWSSDIFENRAPAGSALYTAMIGGAHDPTAVERSDDELIEIVMRDFERCMGIKAIPYLRRIVRHSHGIPQYTLGHLDRVATAEKILAGHSGLWLCGNSYHGVSVNLCVEEAPQVAESVLEYLEARTESMSSSREQ